MFLKRNDLMIINFKIKWDLFLISIGSKYTMWSDSKF